MVLQHGHRVLRPMRYQCRPAGKPAAWDRKYPGTYNARRDNLQGYTANGPAARVCVPCPFRVLPP